MSSRAELLARWHESKHTDFSVYHDPGYLDECMSSWGKTRTCANGVKRYFMNAHKTEYGIHRRYDGGDFRALRVLDVYSGNGLPAIHLAEAGFDVETFNDCPLQVAYMHERSDIKNHTVLPDDRYDIVVSFECIEHFKDPLAHVQTLLSLVKPGGHICESTGFGKDCIGHFNEYLVDGELMNPRRASLRVGKLFKSRAELVFVGYSKMPRIWKLALKAE